MTNMYYLKLQNNEISTMSSLVFMNLPSLQYLHLENNKIQLLKSNTFVNMTNLYYIYLSGNNISHIEEHAFGNLTSLSTLSLTSNPLNCNCSIYPFWSWLIERATIGTTAVFVKVLVLSKMYGDGTLVIALCLDTLGKCIPDNCPCFNGGKCVTSGSGQMCDCIGHWTGEFCQDNVCRGH
ncbi:unnamed protein product [Mytilus coruscus]|uniref:EGF-like domain-containing protein n=1 Tax=Mytilus coruscus TaxID=42192 RepID=A0A6J8F153_MYTCO|nr:unnamed protein product [Mytilus coruscus]